MGGGSAGGVARAWPERRSSRPRTTSGSPGCIGRFETDLGNIACKLYEKEAPNTVRTMVGLAIGKISYQDPATGATMKKRYFDGLTFHRVIPNFMIQGGDPTGTGAGSPGGPGFPYKNENVPSLKFDVAGRLAMANRGKDTNGSQFFITEQPVGLPDNTYTIWGQCENLNVVRAHRARAHDRRPAEQSAAHQARGHRARRPCPG